MRATLLAITLFFFSGFAAATDMTLEVYDTYMLPHKVAAVVDDVLKPGETLQVFGNRLIVRASDDTHQKLLKILKEIDRPPKNFLISIRTTDQYEAKKRYGTTEIQVLDDNTVIHINNQPAPEDGVIVYRGSSSDGKITMKVTAKDNLTTRKEDIVQQVRTLEGSTAYITTGDEIPVTQLVWANGNVLPTTTIDRATTGFYVTPHFSRGEVVLEISLHKQKRQQKQQQEKDTTELSTHLRIPLNEWAPLAGLSDIGQHTGSGTVYSTRSNSQQQQGIEIKVETIN